MSNKAIGYNSESGCSYTSTSDFDWYGPRNRYQVFSGSIRINWRGRRLNNQSYTFSYIVCNGTHAYIPNCCASRTSKPLKLVISARMSRCCVTVAILQEEKNHAEPQQLGRTTPTQSNNNLRLHKSREVLNNSA